MLRDIAVRKSFDHNICYLSILITTIIIIIYSDILLQHNGGAPNSMRSPLLLVEVSATSINYGISQQPITDIQQLMPKLCQNQSVICEGSFCIPGVKKCVCDLRMPVQISRFCLRQIDIDTKCFATNQCNHTVKDAVCVDINSRTVLDAGASKSRLEQWHQLNELKKSSQSTLAKEVTTPSQQQQFQANNRNRAIVSSPSYRNTAFLVDNNSQMGRLGAADQGDRVVPANARNSPYEISYDTPELLHQNHTRRRTNNSDRMDFSQFVNIASAQGRSGSTQTTPGGSLTAISTTALPQTTTPSENPAPFIQSVTTSSTTVASQAIRLDESTDTTGPTSTYTDAVNRKKITIKTTHWPPGVCSCPIGFMFDAMLRKCLALSLADSHCQVDTDCKQIVSSHCSPNSRKCECDEPFVWDQKELACARPKQTAVRTSESTVSANVEQSSGSSSGGGGFLDSIMPPLVLAKLMPDYTMMLIIFVALVIIGTLAVLSITVKCFSSNSSALISPKNKNNKKRPNQSSNSNLHTRSPYATLRRPDHKQPPGSQLANFTQVTRGRILNYDFEQESPSRGEATTGASPLPGGLPVSSATLRPAKTTDGSGRSGDKQYSATLRSGPKGHRHHGKETSTTGLANHKSAPKSAAKREESMDDTPLELNDNISLGGHLESESKSESSNIVSIPGPPPTQQPPYMLKNPMRGQSSAIAAAAAAVANKRLQKKNFDQQQQQQQQSNGRVTTGDGSPVFL